MSGGTDAAPSIYRSKHPDVWAAIDEWKASEKRLTADIKRFRKKYGMGDRRAMTSEGFGSKQFAGFELRGDDWHTPPEHWRRLTQRGNSCLVPYRNKAKGDPGMVADFDAVERVADVRGVWPGMPQYSGFFRSPGAHPDASKTYMYVDWGDGHGPETGKVDLSVWEPVLRSEYHRLKEAGEFPELSS